MTVAPCIRLTRFTSARPPIVTKTVSLGAGGELVKSTPPQMTHGRADVLALRSVQEFAALLPTLTPAQALSYGIPTADGERFEIYSKANLPKGAAQHQIARAKDSFKWPSGPGVLMLDHDPRAGQAPFTRDELLSALDAALPALANVTRVWYPSASSCIFNGDAELSGIKGQRLYFATKDASDIERAGRVIVARLWLDGRGWYEVSKSGALLARTLFDGSVWQTNRLDFAAGAKCEAPLEQRRGDPLVLPGAVELLDTRECLPDLTAEEEVALDDIQRRAAAALSGQVDETRRAFSNELASEIAAGDPERFAVARVVAEHAVLHQRLMGDFPLILNDGTLTTVGAALDDREKYHGRKTRDPLEPGYDGGRAVGKLYLVGGRPNLYSFAHGGRTFKLVRAPRRVESVAGRMSDLVERTLEALRGAPDLFDLGDAVCTIDGGRVLVLTDATLSHHVGHELQFWCWRKTPGGVEYEADIDPPTKLIRTLLDLGRVRRFRSLDAVISAPTIRPDGSVLDRPGYDKHTRLFFDSCGRAVPAIPWRPSERETAEALERLMHPFSDFPFAGDLDRSVLLAALLTAAIRPAVPTAPGFAFDAPIQGSGKTLLARCVGILACGANPPVWPHVAQTRDSEAEIRKRLLTALLAGDAAMVWDNVLGAFDSASIAAFLTAPSMTDRVLGLNRMATVPNRALFIATGNNLLLSGDLPRRFLTCRIDPKTDQPHARRFDLDPAAWCQANRQQMVADALTVIRGWLASDERESGWSAPGAAASFEDWDALVRQAVAWLALRDVQWCDPMESITAAVAADPEAEQLHALLDALDRTFVGSTFTAGDVVKRLDSLAGAFGPTHDENSLAAAVEDIVGRGAVSSKSMGRVLMNRKDRHSGGLVLKERARDRVKNVRVWAVNRV